MLVDEVRKMASKERHTLDSTYNKGNKIIKESIGNALPICEEVKYWLLCNNISVVENK